MTLNELPADDWRRAVYGRSQVGGIGIRRRPRAVDRERIISQQGYICLYCELPIGTKIWRGRREVMLVAQWDHFVPYAYSQLNLSSNWVLACHVCNGIKTARMFNDVESARQVILPERIGKGYESPDGVLHRLGLERQQGIALLPVARPTDRQLEALQLLATGIPLTHIASKMEIGPPRVAALLDAAARRMGATSRSEAVATALRNGFISTPATGDES
ncbi:LuxR C-terminal-related transcriptional regulator [Streptomyces gardneri]|uniref:LuxR C-terminal-related transcriptional regulator n=1 Tax=Streptomyces gardneri TaxID=66892 RepID=UPI0035D8633A